MILRTSITNRSILFAEYWCQMADESLGNLLPR